MMASMQPFLVEEGCHGQLLQLLQLQQDVWLPGVVGTFAYSEAAG